MRWWGLVIRRGPSRQVCTMLWHRQNDTFTLGQWFKGRIYERRCDLSPAGTHFIYFCDGRQLARPVKGIVISHFACSIPQGSDLLPQGRLLERRGPLS